MRRKIRKVTMAVSEDYYEKFEEERKKWQKKHGIDKISQPAFSQIIAKQGLGIKDLRRNHVTKKNKK